MPNSDGNSKNVLIEDSIKEKSDRSGKNVRTQSKEKKFKKFSDLCIISKNHNTSDSTSNYSPSIVKDIEIQIKRFDFSGKNYSRVITFNY